MSPESYGPEDVQRWHDYVLTPEGRAIYDSFVFRAILHAEGIDLSPEIDNIQE